MANNMCFLDSSPSSEDKHFLSWSWHAFRTRRPFALAWFSCNWLNDSAPCHKILDSYSQIVG